jgi:hypothetical protein
MSLLDPLVRSQDVAAYLDGNHYLGRAARGWAWDDKYGVAVFTNPNSKHLPADWLELVRWCLRGEPNDGSRQWSQIAKYLRQERPDVSTVVSYSDPDQGHTGALYRACNWFWAPTWHRLRPPPSGNGSWDGDKQQAVKDRWVFPLRRDERRERVLALGDAGLRLRFPDAEYRDPPRFRS